MATQSGKNLEQSQQQQGQAMTPGSGQTVGTPRRGYAFGLPFTSAEFFRMNPFTLMRRMSEELDRAFSESSGRDQGEMGWAPPIEVTQQDGNYVVRAEIPGIDANDVKLEITDDAIVIQGERKSEHEEKKGGMHVTERRYGRFYRAIPLPEGAKVDEARAKCENGVLEVIVPTEEQRPKAREIPIQGGRSGSGEPSGAKSGSASGSNKAA